MLQNCWCFVSLSLELTLKRREMGGARGSAAPLLLSTERCGLEEGKVT